MINSTELYGFTIIVLVSPWPILWVRRGLSLTRMVELLFALDMVLTIEAAFYSDIVLIALLHVITIPALFVLIYFDLLKQHKSNFRCFVCSEQIGPQEEIETIKRTERGREKQFLVHSGCIRLDAREKKSISERVFRKGIPN